MTKGEAIQPDPVKHCYGKLAGRDGHCTRVKGYGTEHLGWGRCKHHGGCTKSGIQAAAREEMTANHKLFGDLIPVDPGEGLLQEVARSNGFIRFIERALADKGIDQDVIQNPERLLLEMTVIGWQAQAWVSIWQDERKHFVTCCKTALAAGIAERQIRIVEGFATMIGDLIYGLISDLAEVIDAVDPEDPVVRQVAHRAMMRVGQQMAASDSPLVLAPSLN